MFDNVLSSFKNKLESKLTSLNCLKDKVYVVETSEDTDGAIITTYSLSGSNSAYTLLNSWCSSFINETSYPEYDRIPKIVIPNANIGKPSSPSLNLHMYYAIMSLFIQLEAEPFNGEYTEREEDVNYNLINAYADGTKSFEDYNSFTEEFFKRAEYWNIRGHLFEILENAHEGTFIKRLDRLVDNLCSFLDNEEIKYNSAEFTTDDYNSNDENATRPYSKAEKYWSYHNADKRNRMNDLNWKIDNTIELIRQDVQTFYYTLIKLVYDYLRLYEEASRYISSGETFISALQKTSTEPNKSLGDVYAKINVNGFSRYSSELSTVYNYFTKALEARDRSKYKDDDENNIYLRKYYQYEVLKDCRFFERSVTLLNQVQALRTSLDI